MTAHYSDTDQLLFARVQAGDKGAFDDFYRRFFEPLYESTYRRLKDQSACKDILQEVFTDVWHRSAQIRNDNIAGYLHTAVRRQVIRYVTANAQHSYYLPFEQMGAISTDTTDALHYNELLQLLDAWIDTPPPKRKEIFLLHYRKRLSPQQIAERLQLSTKTVTNQLSIIYNDLRGKLPDLAIIVLLSQLN